MLLSFAVKSCISNLVISNFLRYLSYHNTSLLLNIIHYDYKPILWSLLLSFRVQRTRDLFTWSFFAICFGPSFWSFQAENQGIIWNDRVDINIKRRMNGECSSLYDNYDDSTYFELLLHRISTTFRTVEHHTHIYTYTRTSEQTKGEGFERQSNL